MLRQPLKMELRAATVIAAKAGLGAVTPEVLHLGNHTSVRLSPWPIVARIASGTSFDLSHEEVGRELTVAAHLARMNAPSVRPSKAVSPGPYFESDCVITLWEFLEGCTVATQMDERLAAASLREIHSRLADFRADLPPFMDKVSSCETILADPDKASMLAADDRLFLQKVYERLRRDLRTVGGTWQPLHGDSHLANAIITNSGAIWMDLESVCVGPIEWDIAFLPAATWTEFGEIDTARIQLFVEVRALCVATWCWAEFDRSVATKEAARHHLGKLKARFNPR